MSRGHKFIIRGLFSPKGLIISILVLTSYSGIAQSREFLFNNGVNYMLADREMAIKQFNKAIEIDSSFSAAYFYRGVAKFKQGNYEDAISDFNKVALIDSSVTIIHAYNGFAYRQIGKKDESLASFNQYVKSRDELSAMDHKLIGKAKMETGDLEGAIKSFEQALDTDKGESEYYYLFRALYSHGQYQEALVQINKAINEDDEFYGYYINRGNTSLKLGAFEEALTDYDHALVLEPSVPDSYFLRGRALDTLNFHDKAIEDFTKAIELNPEDGTYYSKRGNARYAMGQHEKACMDWTIANNLGYYEDFNKIKSLCE